MNKFIGIGRLTKDAELRYTSSNIATATFTLAINREYSNEKGERETDFINVVVWRKQAENVKKFVTKGSQVAIEGRIQTRNYDDKEGKKVYVTEVIADSVQFLEPKNQQVNADNSNDIEIAMKEQAEDKPYIDFGSTIELTDDDIAF